MGYYSGQGRTYYGSIAIATLCWLARLSCRIIHVQPWMPAILLHSPLHKWRPPHILFVPILDCLIRLCTADTMS